MSILDITKLKVTYEQGIREGIRFATGAFLSNLPPSIEEEIYQKTVEYLVQKYWIELKD